MGIDLDNTKTISNELRRVIRQTLVREGVISGMSAEPWVDLDWASIGVLPYVSEFVPAVIQAETLETKLKRLRPIIDAEIARVRETVARAESVNSEDFDLRGELYRLAFEVAPEARRQDLEYMKEWINPSLGEKAVDIAAGTGFLTIPVTTWTQGKTYAVDPSEVQLGNLSKKKKGLNIQTVVGSLSEPSAVEAIGEDSGNIDLITSYGGLHHVVDQDGENKQRKLFENAAKILKVGGRFVAGDVGADTPLAKHFEVSVKNNCLTSHEEKWLSPERLQKELVEGTGLDYVKSEIVPVEWIFKSEEQMALFMKCLHAYDMTDQEILDDLKSILGYEVDPSGECRLHWPMLLFHLEKRR